MDQKTKELLFTASEDCTVRVWALRYPTCQWKCSQVSGSGTARQQRRGETTLAVHFV